MRWNKIQKRKTTLHIRLNTVSWNYYFSLLCTRVCVYRSVMLSGFLGVDRGESACKKKLARMGGKARPSVFIPASQAII